MPTTIRQWLYGLGAAFIGAFATAAAGALALPSVFNFTRDGLINFAKITLVPALYSMFTYLKQSPLPGSITTTAEVKDIQPAGSGLHIETTTESTTKGA